MFLFTEDQTSIKKLARDLVEEKIEPNVGERADKEMYPAEIMKELAGLGYHGLIIPEEYGGSGLDAVSSMIILHEVSKSDASIGHILETNNFGFCYPLLCHGTENQKRDFLHPCAAGERSGTLAFTEPDGIRPGQVRTVARREKDYYIIQGTKTMISNAARSDYAVVFAKTSENTGDFGGCSTFLIDLKKKGITIGKEEKTMGLQSLKIAEVRFDDVEVPAAALLGIPDRGIDVIATAMKLMRIGNSAIALGLAERAYSEALNFAKTRRINSHLLSEMQTVQFDLADMASMVELMKLSTYYAAYLFDINADNLFLYSSVLKYQVTENAKRICDKALQIFGGYGYIKGFTVERLYRDVRAMTIIGGTSEILKTQISMEILA